MKLILTGKQFEAAMAAFESHLCKPGYDSAVRAALESIELPDTLPTLRPIAEMTETVPEGCVRLFGTIYSDGSLGRFANDLHSMDTHFIDIHLPTAHVDANRAEFEADLKKYLPDAPLDREGDGYSASGPALAWYFWNAAKKGAQP